MRLHPWHDVPLNSDLEHRFPTFVEINRGSRVKYELDKPTGLLRVDPSCTAPCTIRPATDSSPGPTVRTAIHSLVICKENLIPGVLLRARAIGVMPMRDEKGQDDKLIAVHADDPFLSGVKKLSHLSVAEVLEFRRFFQDYKALEGKEASVEHPLGRLRLSASCTRRLRCTSGAERN